jgi:hypothetical protein
MNYSKTPHVCFKAAFASTANSCDEISRIIERRFHVQFSPIRRIKTWFLARWAVVLQVEQKSFMVALVKSKYESDEWIMQVSSIDSPVVCSPELTQICRELHAVLAAVPSISAIRWYFEGFRSQSTAVWTPDELPWSEM